MARAAFWLAGKLIWIGCRLSARKGLPAYLYIRKNGTIHITTGGNTEVSL